jgi:hypothetical protein
MAAPLWFAPAFALGKVRTYLSMQPFKDAAIRLRARLHEIIFQADTPEGKLFDLVLPVAIGTSGGCAAAATPVALADRRVW